MKLKRTIFSLTALSLLSTSILACGNTGTESTNAETSAATESQVESSVEIETATEADTETEADAEGEAVSASDTADNNSSEEAEAPLEDGWSYSALYFSCPDFDIKGGNIAWNEDTKEWNAAFSSPYMYTVLGGTFSDDGTLTLTEDNTGGPGEAYLDGLAEELSQLRSGLQYAYLAFSCPDFDITNGIFAWNEETGQWKAEFPTPYMYTALSGTFENGTLTLTEDNTGGHAEPYMSGLEEAFAQMTSGKMQAPLSFENEDGTVSDGVISWNINDMTWEAAYRDTILGGTYAADGTLTLTDAGADDQAETDMPYIQNTFLQSLKGLYGNPEDAEVVDLNEIVASYPGNAEEYSFDDLTEMENSPLSGKSICILGSSVAYGQASGEYAVGEYLAARFGTTLTKETVSGTTLTDNDDTSYVERMINNLDPEAHFDLFICQLSTNDATKQLPLGEISDSTNRDDFDTSTITGAMEYIISYAQDTWGCPVVFFTGSHYDSAEYDAMVARVEELKDKWGIGVLNLWSDETFNDISDDDRALYMSDDIHPTKAGYKLWWGPELEKQLLEFLE